MSRSSWLAIRTPLSSHRATVCKFGAFLIPLALWSLLCLVWYPDVKIIDSGDGQYKLGDTVERAKFERQNARLLEESKQQKVKESPLKLTDKSFQSLQTAKVPKEVLDKLDPLKGMKFNTQKEFVQNLGPENADLTNEQIEKFQNVILSSAEKLIAHPESQQANLAIGEPSNPIWLPPPHKVALAFYNAFATEPVPGEPSMQLSLWHSCEVVFLGFILSAIVGVPLGILCGTFDLFSKLTEPFIDFIRYMPAPAFGVLCMATLGIDAGPKIGIIWIGTFFQMVLVVANTTRQFDESLLEAAQTLGATKRSLLAKVILPGILPALYNDMRILLGWAWTYLMVGELVGTQTGITKFIYQQSKYQNYENVYAGIIMIGIIGLTVDQILAGLARFLFPWQPKSEGGGAWAAFFGALKRLVVGRPSSATAPVSK